MTAPLERGPQSLRLGTGGLLAAAAIVGAGFFGSRLLGVLRTSVIAAEFGSSPELDAYNVAFRIPDLIFQALAGATVGSAFIPVFARLARREGEARAWAFASSVLNLLLAATAGLCAAAFVLAPWLVPLTAPGLELEGKAVALTRLMLLSPLLFAASGVATGILNGRERFLLSALAPMLYNAAIIFGAAVLSRPWGIDGLAAGVVLGAALHLGIQLPGLWLAGMRYRARFGVGDFAVRESARLMGPRVAGLAAAQVNFLVATYFASKLGAGAISSLTFAWTIAALPVALFGMALSTAVFPRLAGEVADERTAEFVATVGRTLRAIMFLTVPAAVGLVLLREAATTILLQWGEFTAADAGVTATVAGWYALGVIPQAGVEIHSRGFYALSDTRTPVALALLAMAVNFVLAALLWQDRGLEGLAFALSTASWIEWVLLYALFARRVGAPVRAELLALGRFALAGAAMGLVLAGAFAWHQPGERGTSAAVAVAGAVLGGVSYALAARLLGVPEMAEAWSRLRRRGSG